MCIGRMHCDIWCAGCKDYVETLQERCAAIHIAFGPDAQWTGYKE